MRCELSVSGQQANFYCYTSNGTRLNNTCPNNEVGNCDRVEYMETPDSFAKQVGKDKDYRIF